MYNNKIEIQLKILTPPFSISQTIITTGTVPTTTKKLWSRGGKISWFQSTQNTVKEDGQTADKVYN